MAINTDEALLAYQSMLTSHCAAQFLTEPVSVCDPDVKDPGLQDSLSRHISLHKTSTVFTLGQHVDYGRLKYNIHPCLTVSRNTLENIKTRQLWHGDEHRKVILNHKIATSKYSYW